MIEYPQIDRYAHLNSLIHRFDPRAKIISFLFLIFCIVFVHKLELALVGLAGAIIFLVISKIPFRFFIQHIKWVLMFVLLFIVIMPFSMRGEEIFNVYGVAATREGLILGVLITIRAISATILIFSMMATTGFEKTLKALYKLKFPNILVQMFMFSYRYIFTFLEEMQTTYRAMQARGFKPGTNVYTIQISSKALGMLFVKGYERAEKVYQAMQARGYSQKSKMIVEFAMNKGDYILSSVIISFGLSVHVLSFWVI